MWKPQRSHFVQHAEVLEVTKQYASARIVVSSISQYQYQLLLKISTFFTGMDSRGLIFREAREVTDREFIETKEALFFIS